MPLFNKYLSIKIAVSLLSALILAACGGGGSETAAPEPVAQVPQNNIGNAYILDTHPDAGLLSGTIAITLNQQTENPNAAADSVWVYWADENGQATGEAWFKSSANNPYSIALPPQSSIPANTSALVLHPANAQGLSEQGTLVQFHDFKGNAQLSGPGGSYLTPWQYGDDRPFIAVQRIDHQGGVCIFDNGLVSVIDMQNQTDPRAHDGAQAALTANEQAYPAYEFLCSDNPVNTHKPLADDQGIWTYSAINDAMFYGTVVYQAFLEQLKEPPLADKLRIRVHYGSQSSQYIFWDGAYANFSDGVPLFLNLATLDHIAHEVAHGVLNRISPLDGFEQNISVDAQTVHEAFADISGVMVKHAFSGGDDVWVHGEESAGYTRQLNQIETEGGAIASYLDYEDAGDNYYLRIGMLSYPFYLLANKWGITPTYQVYLNAAKHCWQPNLSLVSAAQCIKQQALAAGYTADDVNQAFKTVKIKLFDEGVLSHYRYQANEQGFQFSDNSRSTSEVMSWHWDFGDGSNSNLANPSHTFTEGRYQVTLTVTDQSNDQDSFTRTLAVSSN